MFVRYARVCERDMAATSKLRMAAPSREGLKQCRRAHINFASDLSLCPRNHQSFPLSKFTIQSQQHLCPLRLPTSPSLCGQALLLHNSLRSHSLTTERVDGRNIHSPLLPCAPLLTKIGPCFNTITTLSLRIVPPLTHQGPSLPPP
jgi:hypothetical protein